MIRMQITFYYPNNRIRRSTMYFDSKEELRKFERTLHGISKRRYTYEWEEME